MWGQVCMVYGNVPIKIENLRIENKGPDNDINILKYVLNENMNTHFEGGSITWITKCVKKKLMAS